VLDINERRTEKQASPQVEDGHVRIANELLDAFISFPFSARQQKIVMAVIRKTYGYNKTEDEIGLTQFVKLTGISMKHVSTVISELVEMKVLFVSQGVHARSIKLNKDYTAWVSPKKGEVSPKRVSLKRGEGSPQNGGNGLPNLGNTIDKPKDNTKDSTADKKQSAVSLKSWLQKTKDAGEPAIRDDDPIFDYAETIGITHEMLTLCWKDFRKKNLATNKRQKDWRAHFRNHVRSNWSHIWAINSDGKAFLTTIGRMRQKEFEGDNS
jgi:phage replication O-like protein O